MNTKEEIGKFIKKRKAFQFKTKKFLDYQKGYGQDFKKSTVPLIEELINEFNLKGNRIKAIEEIITCNSDRLDEKKFITEVLILKFEGAETDVELRKMLFDLKDFLLESLKMEPEELKIELPSKFHILE
jgi:hypothetical protein